MARKAVEREQADVSHHDQRSQADAKVPVPAKGVDRVVPEEAQEYQCKKKCVAMQVLQDERKSSLALVAVTPPFVNRTRRRIKKERPVVGLAVVVAGGAEAQRPAQDEQRRRKFPPAMAG